MNRLATHAGRREELDAVFSCLANRDRRLILGRVYEQAPETQTVDALVVSLCDQDPQRSDDSRAQVRAALQHAHLPKLDANNLITWDRTSNAVRSAKHETVRNANILEILTSQRPVASRSLDDLFGSLANARRRIVLNELNQCGEPVQRSSLARKIRAVEQATVEQGENTNGVDGIRSSLYHTHLPKLSDSGLIAYDADANLVKYVGHPLLADGEALSSLVRSSSQF